MNIKRLIITLAVLMIISLVGWAFYYRSKCEGCGGCDYKNFTDTVKIEYIFHGSDSIKINEICFKSIIDTSEIYTFDYFPDGMKANLTEKEIDENIYAISGSVITHGACVPYSIDDVILLKK